MSEVSTEKTVKELLILALTEKCKDISDEDHAAIKYWKAESGRFSNIIFWDATDRGKLDTTKWGCSIAEDVLQKAAKEIVSRCSDEEAMLKIEHLNSFCETGNYKAFKKEERPSGFMGLKKLQAGDKEFAHACHTASEVYKRRTAVNNIKERRSERLAKVMSADFVI